MKKSEDRSHILAQMNPGHFLVTAEMNTNGQTKYHFYQQTHLVVDMVKSL